MGELFNSAVRLGYFLLQLIKTCLALFLWWRTTMTDVYATAVLARIDIDASLLRGQAGGVLHSLPIIGMAELHPACNNRV